MDYQPASRGRSPRQTEPRPTFSRGIWELGDVAAVISTLTPYCIMMFANTAANRGQNEEATMWLISTPKSYLTTFVAGMAFGFALGVAATRTRASGLDLDYVITAPMCPQYSSQIPVICVAPGPPDTATICKPIPDGSPVCFQVKARHTLKAEAANLVVNPTGSIITAPMCPKDASQSSGVCMIATGYSVQTVVKICKPITDGNPLCFKVNDRRTAG
jgi:hypothetical protein